jgi:two-component system chemotaxis sensor kinase CheA
LPLTLSVLEALLIRADSDFFFLPLSEVGEVLSFDPETVSAWQTTGEILTLRNRHYPVYVLSSLVGNGVGKQADSVIIAKTHRQEVALLVDEIIGRQQIYIKPLPDELKTKQIFSGVTILRTGQIAFVLEMSRIDSLKSISKRR